MKEAPTAPSKLLLLSKGLASHDTSETFTTIALPTLGRVQTHLTFLAHMGCSNIVHGGTQILVASSKLNIGLDTSARHGTLSVRGTGVRHLAQLPLPEGSQVSIVGWRADRNSPGCTAEQVAQPAVTVMHQLHATSRLWLNPTKFAAPYAHNAIQAGGNSQLLHQCFLLP